MKNFNSTRIMIGVMLIAFYFVGCSKNDNEIKPTNPNQLRTIEQELAFVKNKANSLAKNSKGYWEADFGNGLIFIYVPKGSFTMGNNALSSSVVTGSYSSAPEHQVTLNHYWIAKTPVTIGQFRAFVQATNYVTDVEKSGNEGAYVYDFSSNSFQPKKGYNWSNAYKDILAKIPQITITDKHPVTCVSWNDAIAYTKWLAQQKGLKITLPTEAEFEYASRGNDGRMYPWGDEVSDGTKANYADESFNKYFSKLQQSIVHTGVTDGFTITSPVGSFPNGASPIGALDMVGNVNQWVYDSEYDYTSRAKNNPVYVSNNSVKMQKGGDWSSSAGRANQNPNELSEGHNIRAEGRSGDAKNSADDHLGFRIAISYTMRN